MNFYFYYFALPLAGAALVYFMAAYRPEVVRRCALLISGATLLIAALALIPDDKELLAAALPDSRDFALRANPSAAAFLVSLQLAVFACIAAHKPLAGAKSVRTYSLMLAAQAFLGGLPITSGWAALTLFWSLSGAAVCLLLRTPGDNTRAFNLFHAASVLIMAAGTTGLALHVKSWWPEAALLAAAYIRMGLFPSHFWHKNATDAERPSAALITGPFAASGLYVFSTACGSVPGNHWIMAAVLVAMFHAPLAALASPSAPASLGYMASAHCSLFALTAALGTPGSFHVAVLGATAQALAATLAMLSADDTGEKPLMALMALAGAPFTVTFTGLFLSAAMLFKANIYLAAALLMAALFNAAAAAAMPGAKHPCASHGKQPLADPAQILLAAAIIAAGIFPLLPSLVPPF